jgi:hypothetical protein
MAADTHQMTFAGVWTTRELHTRILARHQLAEGAYRLSQLRYDLSKLRAKGLVERLGNPRSGPPLSSARPPTRRVNNIFTPSAANH